MKILSYLFVIFALTACVPAMIENPPPAPTASLNRWRFSVPRPALPQAGLPCVTPGVILSLCSGGPRCSVLFSLPCCWA